MFGFRVLGFGAFTVADTTFSVANSARFNDGDSDHLLNTPRSAISERIGTISFWVKRGVLGTTQAIFSNERNDANSTAGVIEFQSDDQLRWKAENTSGSNIMVRETTQVFRDPHAWYHILCNWNSNKTDDSGANVYVNGNQVSSFATKTNFASAQDLGWPSSAKEFEIGRQYNGANYLDGYLAQFAFVDGIQLTPTTFGQFDTVGRWTPINVTTQDALQVGSTAEAIVNSASSVSTSDGTSYTFSSVALGTASSTRAAYVWISGQESTGTAGTITATINTGGGAVAMTKIRDINNATEAHYQGSLFRADISSGTSADIVASATRGMSQLGVIVWTVTGDHHIFDLKVDTDTSSAVTTTVDFTNVPANSVILAGRGSATGDAHTWSSNLTENIDEKVEETGVTDVRHTGASTATASGGDFTITCTPDSGADSRGRMFALVLSPTEGAGRNGFWLQFDAGTGAALGTNSRPDSLTFTPVAAAYTYNSTYLTIGSGTADNNGTPGVSGRLNNPFSGDFTFSTTATAIAGAIFGCFDADELGTFATGTDDGALDSMTKSWWYDDGGDGSGGAGSVGAGKIMYGNATQATSAIANGSVVTISRTDSTIKITDDGSAIHTFSQTHAGPVFIMIGHRNITSKSMNFDSITMTGTQGFTPV